MTATFTPRPYQHAMLSHALDVPRCALWAGMGLGKSVATLTALDALELTEPGPALVLAPLRVARSTWPDEAAKWSHLRNVEVAPVVGTPEARKAALRRPANVFTTNYEQVPWLVDHFGDRCLPPIRVNTRLREAPSARKTIFEYAPTSHGALDYSALVDRIVRLRGDVAPLVDEALVG